MSSSFKSIPVVLLVAISLYAETHITGDITGMTFESGGNPFIVEQDILIPSGNKAVIKEGCVFLFKPFTGLTVHGHLLVEGTQEQPVVFSSINDGEHNLSSEQLPNPFDWNGILITRESGTVSLMNFHLFFSVYGIKSQKPNIVIDNGVFKQNGQFHFTINDKIQFVQDNIPYSYKYDEKNPPKPDKPVVKTDSPSSASKKVKIVRFTSLGIGVAGAITGGIFGIKMAVQKSEWDVLSEKNKIKPDTNYNYLEHKKTHYKLFTGTIIGSAFGVLGLTAFGITFLY